MAVTWAQALAWRLRRHLLDPAGTAPVEGVVGRLGAVPAQPAPSAELAVRVRSQRSGPGDVARALADGRVIATFAFRGATHLLTPEEGGAYLALRAASRMWELPSWRTSYDLAPADWPPLRAAVRDALAGGPLTRAELAAAVTALPRFRHLGPAFTDPSATFLKPFAWQGDLSFGPPRGGRLTFQRLDHNARWAGLPDLADAGRFAIESYVRTYGPAPPDRLTSWLGEGLSAGRKRIRGWVADLGDRLATVDVEGESAYVLSEDVDELEATAPTTVVRLLPGYDQWVLGPGTADPHVVPPSRRGVVSRGADLVVAGGVVSGTWSLSGDDVVVSWFDEAGPAPQDALAAEVERLGTIRDQDLRLDVGGREDPAGP